MSISLNISEILRTMVTRKKYLREIALKIRKLYNRKKLMYLQTLNERSRLYTIRKVFLHSQIRNCNMNYVDSILQVEPVLLRGKQIRDDYHDHNTIQSGRWIQFLCPDALICSRIFST